MEDSWFDSATGLLRFDEIVAQRPTFQKIMADGAVTPQEFRDQADKVHGLMRQLEGMLAPEAKTVATDTLAELAVLLALSARVSSGA
ncbi:MAG: hypothetical protein SFU56_20710 [Capsulimonadales bacterium]|nr:hypothetical protein [Capsulimonadales bacterium]